MPDFSELAKYLSEQIDLGDSIVLLDEPWLPPKPPRSMISSTAAPINPPVKTAAYTPKPPSEPPKKIAPLQPKATQIVIPESAKSTTPSAYESAQSLDEFYHLVSTEKIYAKTPFAKGEGNLASPRILLVIYSPQEKYLADGYLHSDVGQMVSRMFGSLNIPPEEIAITYFCKKQTARIVLPQVAQVLKKMLEKEVSLIHPKTVVFFGDKLLKQALSQNSAKMFDFGGTPLEFAQTQATALIEPEEMFTDKQLKLLTWKIHIPKCGFFAG